MKRILFFAMLALLCASPAFAGEVKIDPRWGEGFDITQDWCSRLGSEVDGRACMDKRGNFFPNFVYLFKPDHSMVYYYPKGHREHEGHPTWEIKEFNLSKGECEAYRDAIRKERAQEYEDCYQRYREREKESQSITILPCGGGMIPYKPSCPSEMLLRNLNKLLKQGWELQGPYDGEEDVYLKRRVKP